MRRLLDKLDQAARAGLAGDGQEEPVTGWEQGLGELAGHLSRVAAGIESAARSHRHTVADYRSAIRIVGA